METNQTDPRRQLEEYDEAVRASEARAWQPAPPWLFPLLALAGPAMVAWSVAGRETMADQASQATFLRVVSIVLWAVAFGAILLAAYRERANAEVRSKPPIRGGRTTGWMWLANFALVFGLLLTGNLVPAANPWLVAVGSYLWFVIVPWMLWSRHVKVLTRA